MNETDLFIVGGGPAGLVAAIAARRSGFSVTLADAARPPIDKACGEGIMPDGLAALAEFGITIPLEKASVFRGIRFLDSENSVDAQFVGGCGLGVRRPVLHELLVDHALRSGVRMHWGTRVTGLRENRVQLDGREIRCRWVVGADGMTSRIRAWAGLEKSSRVNHRFGFRQHFPIKPWSDFVEVHWTNRGQLYVTPVSEEEICVALVTHDRGHRLKEAITNCSTIPSSLREAIASTREQGALSASRSLKSVVRGPVALIGEASGSVDSVTGEGMSIAFRQALALERALREDDLSIYQTAHRKLMRLPRAMAELMLLMDRRQGVRMRALHALAGKPELFGRMLAVHSGKASPMSLGIRATTSLGWHMLTA
jgi:flavin-dependent dehydrogenase